jgi:hypothetical protein
MEWKPISLSELQNQIETTEVDLKGELANFWQLIKIEPTKWSEKEYGDEGNGFWVVAITKTKVVWYNDIEEGFNISDYDTHGQINGYYSNEDELRWALATLFEIVKRECSKVE